MNCISLSYLCNATCTIGIANITNRKFQTGKTAKKAGEAMESLKAQREPTEEDIATQELLEAYRQQRGPSLMESHTEHIKLYGKPQAHRKPEPKAFDRDNVSVEICTGLFMYKLIFVYITIYRI